MPEKSPGNYGQGRSYPLVRTKTAIQEGILMQRTIQVGVFLTIALLPSYASAGPGGPDGDEIIFRSSRELNLFGSLLQNDTVRARISSLSRKYVLSKIRSFKN